ncbi:MAG: hypothetical protein IT430_09095 [Phycisphaerales bacterium]|nr:hypothetical protein [Phycisphaerales bacterium]
MRRRLRSTCKWGGTVLTVLLLVVWVGSVWWECSLGMRKTGGITANGGMVSIWYIETPDHPRIEFTCTFERHLGPMQWWFDSHRFTTGAVTVGWFAIPTWVIVLPFGVPALWLWYHDRRHAPGLCVKCGYDLRGTAHAVCPECGAQCERIDRRPAEQVSGGSPN